MFLHTSIMSVMELSLLILSSQRWNSFASCIFNLIQWYFTKYKYKIIIWKICENGNHVLENYIYYLRYNGTIPTSIRNFEHTLLLPTFTAQILCFCGKGDWGKNFVSDEHIVCFLCDIRIPTSHLKLVLYIYILYLNKIHLKDLNNVHFKVIINIIKRNWWINVKYSYTHPNPRKNILRSCLLSEL